MAERKGGVRRHLGTWGHICILIRVRSKPEAVGTPELRGRVPHAGGRTSSKRMVQSPEQRLPISKSAGLVGDPAGGAGSCRLQHDLRILRIPRRSQEGERSRACQVPVTFIDTAGPQARQLLHKASGVPCLGAFAACAVRLTALSCRLKSRSYTPTRRRLGGCRARLWAVCCKGCRLGGSSPPPPPHPRNGPMPVSSLYGDPDMVCLIPRHEPRGRYPIPWATEGRRAAASSPLQGTHVGVTVATGGDAGRELHSYKPAAHVNKTDMCLACQGYRAGGRPRPSRTRRLPRHSTFPKAGRLVFVRAATLQGFRNTPRRSRPEGFGRRSWPRASAAPTQRVGTGTSTRTRRQASRPHNRASSQPYRRHHTPHSWLV